MTMHAMTIDPKTGLPRGEQSPASTAAVVSLVCGILLCLGPFTGIPAIIAGVLGRKAARDFPESVGGSGMASAGLALGILNLVLSLSATALALWRFLDRSAP
jgi:ABC-type phosphate transport system permease subunit